MYPTSPPPDPPLVPATDLVPITTAGDVPSQVEPTDAGHPTADHVMTDSVANDDGADAADERAVIVAVTPVTPARKSSAASVASFIKSQDFATPRAHTTHASRETGNQTEIRDLLELELDDGVQADKAWLGSLYQDLASDEAVQEYLRNCGLYQNKRWIHIPEAPASERVLYRPYRTILNSIFSHFGLSGPGGTVRRAVDTHRKHLSHASTARGNPTTQWTSPDISVEASGPSFTLPSNITKYTIGYPNMATYLDGKLDKDAGKDHLPQMGSQMFIQQPNRKFVRSLLFTEQKACLFHFDRSGAQYSQFFDVHAGAATFVRIILGLCSTDERVLGFDDSVQWTVGQDGKRTGGALKAINSEGEPVEYDLVMGKAIFVRSSIRGRGTVYWPVRDREKGKRFIVKDYWMSQGRTPEYDYLKRVKGMDGVCNIISYETGRGETKDYRGSTQGFTSTEFHNRKAIRIVMDAYGTSIDNFTSPEELLAALRDAIAAHERLNFQNILHRDISHSNVLIGLDIDDKGNRGILIDLDMAIGSERTIADICEDLKTGTPLFWPLVALKGFLSTSLAPEDAPAHDYLDGLEAFFWIYFFLIFMFKSNGEEAAKGDIQIQYIVHWRAAPEGAWKAKYLSIQEDWSVEELKASLDQSWYSTPCIELLVQFRKYMCDLVLPKCKGIAMKAEPLPDGSVPNRFAKILAASDKHYTYILGLFDDALKKVERAPRPNPEDFQPQRRPRTRSLGPARQPEPVIIPQDQDLSRGSKRRTQEAAEEESPTKPKRKRPIGRSGLSQSVTAVSQDADSG